MAGRKNQVFENREVILMKLGHEVLTQKDVKNEDCSG
jgi:hypothetical protein